MTCFPLQGVNYIQYNSDSLDKYYKLVYFLLKKEESGWLTSLYVSPRSQ